MKILVVSQYFYPENFRINSIVEELVKRGHQITVLTGLPNYPEGKIYEGFENKYEETQDYCGATIHRCKLRPRYKGTINLFLNYLSFIRQANKTLKKIKPDFDFVYVYGLSPITSGLPAIRYGKKNRIRTIIYNLDIWPESVRDLKEGKVMSKFNPVYIFAKIISKYIYGRYDLIINKCSEFGNYLNDVLNINKSKMVTLFEHAEDDYFLVNETPIDNGIIDFMFLGNIGQVQNCNQIVDAFSMIDNSSAVLHFVGDGSYLESLKEKVLNLKIQDKIKFHGRHLLPELISYYNLADVCLLTLSSKTAIGLTPPAKLVGYMAASRCIVASINGAAKKIIEDAKCGFCCPANDVNALAHLMQKIIHNPKSINGLGKNGRNYFHKHFTLEKHVNVLESYLLKLSDTPKQNFK